MAHTASVSTGAVDALLEAWAEATCTLSHLRTLAATRIKVQPDDELAAFVLILTAED